MTPALLALIAVGLVAVASIPHPSEFAPKPEAPVPTTIGGLETKRQATKAKLAADMESLKTITQTVADDNTTLVSDTGNSGAGLKASGKNGAGPFTRPDGSVYVLIVDTSADGFHEVDLAGPDTVIPDSPAPTVPPPAPEPTTA